MKALLPPGSKGKLHVVISHDVEEVAGVKRKVTRRANGAIKTLDGTRYNVTDGILRRETVKPTPKWERAKARRAKA